MVGILFIGVYLVRVGISVLHQFHPADPFRWVFGLPPLLLAAAMALATVLVLWLHCRDSVRLDQTGVHFRRLHIAWEDLQVQSSPKPAAIYRRLRLTHRTGKQRLDLHDLFLPGLDELESNLVVQKLRHSRRGDEILALD